MAIPAFDADGKLWSVQYVNEDGSKRFARESRKEGCFHVVGSTDPVGDLQNADAIVVAEGYATAAAALAAPSGTYNICDDEPVPWCQFLQVLSHAAGAPAPFRIPAFLGPLLLGFAWKYLSRSHRVSNRRLNRSPVGPRKSEAWSRVGRCHPGVKLNGHADRSR